MRRIVGTVIVTATAAMFYGLLAAAVWILLCEVTEGMVLLLR